MAREYDIQSVSGRCSKCGRELAGGEEFLAALFETEEGFRREDICRQCSGGDDQRPAGAYSVWTSRIPPPDEPKKRFVDNEVLIGFFGRLADEDDPVKVNFRFVLALMLMRKKLLVHDGARRDDEGRDVWTMHFRKQDVPLEVIHPEMNEEQIAAVTAEVAAIFEVQS